MTSGREDGESSGSDSEPSADNLEEEEIAEIVPIKKKPDVKKEVKVEEKKKEVKKEPPKPPPVIKKKEEPPSPKENKRASEKPVTVVKEI